MTPVGGTPFGVWRRGAAGLYYAPALQDEWRCVAKDTRRSPLR